MPKRILLVLLAALVACGALARFVRGAASDSPAAYLIYTGGVFGQLEPCG